MRVTLVKDKYIYCCSVTIINTIYFFLLSIVILNIHRQITSKNLVVARFDEVPLLFCIEIFMFSAILGLIKMQLVMIKVDVARLLAPG